LYNYLTIKWPKSMSAHEQTPIIKVSLIGGTPVFVLFDCICINICIKAM
jgi:hypothetical protein